MMRRVDGRRWGALVVGAAALAACDGVSAPAVRPPDLVVALGNGVTMEFVLVHAGTFRMGTVDGFGEVKAPFREVTVARDFHMARYEVTQEQWQALMGTNPSRFKGPRNPVESVSWSDCQEFLAKLSEKTPGTKFVLPSEAQWEYACRAGSTSTWSFGDREWALHDFAWYGSNADGTTHPVGGKSPNAWGFYDMHGNVMERCSDSSMDEVGPPPPMNTRWGAGRYPVTDASKSRVVRGGAFFYGPLLVGSAARGEYGPTADLSVGLRPATFTETNSAAVEQPSGSAGGSKSAAPQPPLDPVAAEARATELLEIYRGARFSNEPDPLVLQLVGIGRPAMGPLVRVICEPEYRDEPVMRLAALKALPDVAAEEDAPMLALRIREGHVELETAFEHLDSPQAVATLAALIREGRFGQDLDRVIAGQCDDPAIVAACVAWLGDPKYEGNLDAAVGAMVSAVAGNRPNDRSVAMPGAVPALAALPRKPLRLDTMRLIATALVRIGDKTGVPELIDVLATGADASNPDRFGYEPFGAGEELNAVSGTHGFAGRVVHDESTGSTRWQGNFAEAATAYRAWWAKSKDALHFDPATREWSAK